MDITVIGTGYVGLVTAVGLAELGHRVMGIDNDLSKVRRLQAGDPVIYEPGLGEMLERQLAEGRLLFSGEIAAGVQHGSIIFICVGTPPRADGSADLSQVEAVARQVAHAMPEYRLIVEKSTVPVRTSQRINRTMLLHAPRRIEFEVASNPEFLREGSALQDFFQPDRIVVGAPSPRAADLLLEVYAPMNCPKIITDTNTAEVIKHASNCFLALKISYINLIADLCESADADVHLVAEAMGHDRRIGTEFLQPGLGYGGACLPKDVQAFVSVGEELGLDFGLLRQADAINRRRPERVLAKLKRALWILEGKQVAVLGLAFKANTDDVRGSTALSVARALLESGASVRLYDPRAAARAAQVLPPSDRILYASSAMDALQDAHAAVIATPWDEFRSLDLQQVARVMATPVLVDGRNVLDPAAAAAAGFEYYPMGRPAVCSV